MIFNGHSVLPFFLLLSNFEIECLLFRYMFSMIAMILCGKGPYCH